MRGPEMRNEDIKQSSLTINGMFAIVRSMYKCGPYGVGDWLKLRFGQL